MLMRSGGYQQKQVPFSRWLELQLGILCLLGKTYGEVADVLVDPFALLFDVTLIFYIFWNLNIVSLHSSALMHTRDTQPPPTCPQTHLMEVCTLLGALF